MEDGRRTLSLPAESAPRPAFEQARTWPPLTQPAREARYEPPTVDWRKVLSASPSEDSDGSSSDGESSSWGYWNEGVAFVSYDMDDVELAVSPSPAEPAIQSSDDTAEAGTMWLLMMFLTGAMVADLIFTGWWLDTHKRGMDGLACTGVILFTAMILVWAYCVDWLLRRRILHA